MRYAIICGAFMAACLLVGWLIVRGLARWRHVHWSRPRRVALTLLCASALLCLGAFCYLSMYYHADDTALDALESDDVVQVDDVEEGYRFDGPGAGASLVFLPGAKVQTEAYAPLMHRMAAQGIDCYLVDPPFRFAFFGMSRAQHMLAAAQSPTLLVGGHSLGGVVAASLAESSDGQCDGVVLLGSSLSKALGDDIALLSVVGTEDGVLNRDAYESGRALWPAQSTELVIEGGNHAGFGCYGPQEGDGEAAIDATEQQRQTAEGLVAFVGEIGSAG